MERVGYTRLAAALAVAALVVVPLAGIAEYPHRISVLPSLQVDAVTYDAIGLDLANRRTLDAIPPLQPPGFVAMLAAIFTVFGHSWLAAKLALWLAWLCVIALSGWLAARLHRSEPAGWIAAVLCAGSPALMRYTQTLQYELPAALLVLTVIMLAIALRVENDGGTTRRAVLLGVVAGLAVLTRELLVVLVPIVALAFALRVAASTDRRAAMRAGVTIVVVAASMTMGWSLLQSTRAGRLVGISDKGPLVMAFGNNPLANGTFNAGAAGVGEPSGWAFIRDRPAHALWLAGRKLQYFWGWRRDGWNVPRPAAVWVSRATAGSMALDRWLPWARGGWILATLVVALAMWPRAMWRTAWMLPAAIALVMLVHVVTLGSHRFAVPILPLAFVISAGPIAAAVRAIWRRPARRAIAAVLILAAVAMQAVPSAMTYRLQAADMDGVQADTIDDDLAGGRVRTADTARGVRPVLLLTDEFLPAGDVDVRITARLEGAAARDRAVFRLAMTALDGKRLCEHAVNAAALAPTFTTVSLPCVIDDSGPVTLTVDTLAVAPLRFSDVTLTWPGQLPQ